MFTQHCRYFKNRTCKKIEKDSPVSNLFADFKKICRFLIILWISKRFVVLQFFVDLKKTYRFESFSGFEKGFSI